MAAQGGLMKAAVEVPTMLLRLRLPSSALAAAGLLVAIVCSAAPAAADDKRILVFGDSISWGWVPTEKGFPTSRYPVADRWPTIMAEALGPGFRVLVNAVSGRTTDVDYAEGQDTLSGSDFNGLKALPSAIATEMPLDLVIVFLGTNDLRSDVNRTPEEIATGAMRVAALVAKSTGAFTIYSPPKALVVVPPPLGDVSKTPIRDLLVGATEKSRRLSAAYAAAAAKVGIAYFDAGAVTATDGVDGVHFSADANRRLGIALASKVRAMLGP
jgi:lysophospholipase L1-like esterase